MVFNLAGEALAFIRLPKRCANLTFGGPKNNRLYMTTCHSVYSDYVEAHRAVGSTPIMPGLDPGIHILPFL